MEQTSESFSIIQAFMNFADLGAEWVMWLMLGMGFVLIVVAIERGLLYAKTRIDAPAVARRLVPLLAEGKVSDAQALVAEGKAMEERVLADALEVYGKGPLAVEQMMASSLAREKQRFDRFLNYMGTVGSNAPFIGLFGTVIGILITFKELGANPKGGLEVVGPGIAEALVATAVGLLVAIPAVVLYNLFKGTVKERVGNTNFLLRIVLAQVSARPNEAGGSGD